MKFYDLATYFERIEQTSGRIAITELLAEIFKSVDPAEARRVAYLIQGRVAPTFVEVEFGIGEKLLVLAIVSAFDIEPEQASEQVRALGDHGLAAEKLWDAPGGSLTVSEVFDRLDALARTAGEGSVESKVSQLSSLMRDLGPLENRYLVRIPLERLRLGVGDPTIMDGLSFARVGDKSERAAIERAYNYVSDLGLVAERYVEGGADAISRINVAVGNPVRMAQAERLSSGAAIVEKIGECAVEPKFDGFRLQIHRSGDDVSIFSRNLENMTGMFPEVAEAARTRLNNDNVIIEGEAMGYDPDTFQFLPFQITLSRRRKHGIAELADSLPLKLLAFDVLHTGAEDLTPLPYTERRKRLLELVDPNETIAVTESIVTDDPDVIDAYFADKIEDGFEGIVVKRLESPYQAGKRNFNWIKLKGSYTGDLSDALDCAIVGYWRGRGKRSAWGIGAILSAVWDSRDGLLKTIARVGTGYSDEEWVQMRELLDKDARNGPSPLLDSAVEADVWVEPRHVVPVLADELTRSPNHTAGRSGHEPGYALRFPRVLEMPRPDKGPQDATTVDEVQSMFDAQIRGSASPS